MIKNIIFDVGEVLLTYRWIDILMESGCSHEDAARVKKDIFSNDNWHNKFDKGFWSEKEIMAYLIEKSPEDEYIYKYFFAHPEGMPVRRPAVYELLPKLKEKGYSLFILSDYSDYLSEIHFNFGGFRKYMDGEIISYKVNLVKPDIRIFERLLSDYDLDPSECIFLDDKKENIEGCEKAGIKGYQITSEERLIEILNSLL